MDHPRGCPPPPPLPPRGLPSPQLSAGYQEMDLYYDDQEMDLDTFYRAVRDGDVQTVRRGLEAGVDVNVRHVMTPLHVASELGQTEVAELLIQHGAELEARDYVTYFSTPLHQAAAKGHTGTCELLIRSGADVIARDKDQSTPLHEAAERGHTGICELLIHSGADVMARNEHQSIPLHRAAYGGHTETCELLIRSGTDVMARNKDQTTPLHLAAEQGHTRICELLIGSGADVIARNEHQSTTLHLAAAMGHTGTCDLLIHSGADVITIDSGLRTPLHWAAARGLTGTCELLIHSGADVMARDEDQSTPLHLAADQGNTGICELLIHAGADVMARTEFKYTPLHLAADGGHTGICELLIHSGADVMARTVAQWTPLHQAARERHTGTCELLIHNGADVMTKNKVGTTPLAFARDPETRRQWKNLDKQMKQEKAYHELLQKSGGVKVNRCKVFIGGTEATGKSTLRKSLKKGLLAALAQKLSTGSAKKPHDPTPGVDIETFHVPGVGEVSVWDFAGQSEYAVTHSMFMDAENTVFIVLYNIMDDSEMQEKQVHWWLSFIKSCNPNRQPDVILVGSHADQVALTKGQRRAHHVVQTMKAEFKDHLCIADEVILMDCRKTRTPEMDRLKALLVEAREAMLQHQRDMPQLCAKIMERLPKLCDSKSNQKYPVMMWPVYMDEVRKLDRFVTEDFLEQATGYLHHLGELHFITTGTSDPIVVLKPSWLGTDVFGPTMAPDNFPIPRRLRTSQDYVTRAEIQHVFQDVADVDLVITLFVEFQLCHSYDGQNYIFPGLLTQTMPPDKWQLTQEQKVVYFGKQVQCADSTDMFSSGFFPRVQTRLMRELQNRPLLWRDGAKCVDRNVEGLIKLSPDGRAVNICVRSVQGDKVQCGKMLQQLENIIADVLDECSPGTGTVEKVLSARALKEHREEFYSYGKEEISKAKAEGGTISHPTLGFTEHVSDLLCREEKDSLTRNRPDLVQALRNMEPILDRLQAHGILTVEECDMIRANGTPQDRARALIDSVSTKGEEARQVFQSVLREVDPHAADMLMPTQTDELQDREEGDQLTRHRPQLVEVLRHVGPILNHLHARDVLSTEECDIIRAKATPQDRARTLLDTVRSKGEDARQVFKAVLQDVDPVAAEILQGP